MKHYNTDEWLAYINDKIPELKREEMEEHLLLCDQCLEVYMNLLEDKAEELPIIQNEGFTDETLRNLPKKKQKQKKLDLQSPIFHYGVAAAVTFILMTSGFFQSVTGIVSTVEASSDARQEKPVSEGLMEKALSLFDIIEGKQKEGQK
ncbi:hypothetical protein [Fredinandcohnia sp. 179-A 10B2 NHS]|uniref:hypothetical protein n=1 Tax=Fredinandcohnia sp. 179-A 10B2 NHS TaxID=3235176 RepID=UPI0039A16102